MKILPKDFYYKSNKLQQLRGFYFTAQTGTVSAAAKKMYLNQSTVSIQIQSLERDLETKLFERKGPKLSLSKDGETLYRIVLPLIEGIDSVYERFNAEKNKKALARINVAANHISAVYILPKIISRFHAISPKTEIKVCNIPMKEGLSRLLEDEVHILMGPLSKVPNEFLYYPIFTYSPILIVKKDHPLTKKKNITLEDIGSYPALKLDSKQITVPTFKEIAKQYNFDCNVIFENGDWLIIKKLVKEGIGTAVVLDMCIEGNDHLELDVIPLNKFFPLMSYGITLKKGKYILPHVRDFIKTMKPDFVFEE